MTLDPKTKESPRPKSGASHRNSHLPLDHSSTPDAILARTADILTLPVFWGCVALLSNVVALVSFLAGAR